MIPPRKHAVAEDQGGIIDQDISDKPTEGARHCTHNDSHPPRVARSKGLGDTHHDKETESDGIEEEEGVIEPYDLPTEDDGEGQCQPRDNEIRGLYEPEGL